MIKDYDLNIQYHPRKENFVADALSRTGVSKTCMPLILDLDCMGISFCYANVANEETQLLIQSSLHEKVHMAQFKDRLLHVSLVWRRMELFILEDIFVCHRKLK